MPQTCWAPGCKSGYRSVDNTDRHLFQVPNDAARIRLWQKHIPRVGELTSKHSICDLHFEDRFVLKTYPPVTVDGKDVLVERGRWGLTKDAVPTIFPQLPKYLSSPGPRKRSLPAKHQLPVTTRVHSSVENEDADKSTTVVPETDECQPATSKKRRVPGACVSCRCGMSSRQAQCYNLKRQLARYQNKAKQLNTKIAKLSTENKSLKKRLSTYENLPPKLQTIVQQTQQNTAARSKHGNRYSLEWILDCLLIRCKSTAAYKMLRENGYLPLPSRRTLNRTIKAMRPEFGFDKALSAGLTEKLTHFTDRAKRGVLMFDEIQISKNIDFRVDTGKMVGFVDFGELTTEAQTYQEGNHALVFLFRPHMGGWVQTIGCFCSAATTPSAVLAKLILQAVILLENCGAKVDGLVSDGASANRAALASLGFNGSKEKLNNRMTNPCDDSRFIYFICDMPHLLKTIRNNLLAKKEFLTPVGTVKLSHYEALLQHDLHASTGLRAVPRLTDKHIAPNNFQKMSVRLAAQLFSNSTATGLLLYQPHVAELTDVTATVAFTRRINDMFDLMNSRAPCDAIWKNGRRDKLQELRDTSEWLDQWESFVQSQPDLRQKLFLSRQTSQGLRVTLKSALELSSALLSSGFGYVMTGKFCQDPLEVAVVNQMFFGIVRQSCGGDDHPTANQFLYVYRLLSVSSLVKPGRRASVQSDPAQILLSLQSAVSGDPQPSFVPQIEHMLDSLLQDASHSAEQVVDERQHDYSQSTPEESILFYLGGYVAHKLAKFTQCESCVQSLSNTDNLSSSSRLVELRTHGGLKFPSGPLTGLISLLERSFAEYSSTPSTNMYFDILNDVLVSDALPAAGIGCQKHRVALTSRCIHFYISTRLHFLKKSVNRNRSSREAKHKLSKISKLT